MAFDVFFGVLLDISPGFSWFKRDKNPLKPLKVRSLSQGTDWSPAKLGGSSLGGLLGVFLVKEVAWMVIAVATRWCFHGSKLQIIPQ